MTNTIPKQELLTKLLMLTTSNNDAEALQAVRKANALLKASGWDWQQLINGKITIVEDPFKGLATPTNGQDESLKREIIDLKHQVRSLQDQLDYAKQRAMPDSYRAPYKPRVNQPRRSRKNAPTTLTLDDLGI